MQPTHPSTECIRLSITLCPSEDKLLGLCVLVVHGRTPKITKFVNDDKFPLAFIACGLWQPCPKYNNFISTARHNRNNNFKLAIALLWQVTRARTSK